jgi:hypothetical protein
MACSTIRIVFERSYLRLRSVYMLSPAGAGLRRLARTIPRARGLALDYTLSPAGAACGGLLARYPGLADSPLVYTLSPAGAGLRGLGRTRYPGLADSPWATCFRPLARARAVSLFVFINENRVMPPRSSNISTAVFDAPLRESHCPGSAVALRSKATAHLPILFGFDHRCPE